MRRLLLTLTAVALVAAACNSAEADRASLPVPTNGPIVIELTADHAGRAAGTTLVLTPEGDVLSELPPKPSRSGAGGAIAVGAGRTLVTGPSGLELAAIDGSTTPIAVDPPTPLVLTRLLASSDSTALIDGGPAAPLVIVELDDGRAQPVTAAGASVQRVFLTKSGESAVATTTEGTFIVGLTTPPTAVRISSSLDARLLLDDDLVVVAERGPERSEVVALDLDGSVHWRTDVDGLLGITVTGDTIVAGSVGAVTTFDAEGTPSTFPVDDGLAPIDLEGRVTLLSGRTSGYWYTFDPATDLLREHTELRGKFDLVRTPDRVLFTAAGGDYREIADAALLDLGRGEVDQLQHLIGPDERAWPVLLGPFGGAMAAVLTDTVRILPLDDRLPFQRPGELVTFSPDGTRMIIEDQVAEVTVGTILVDSRTGTTIADLGPATVLAWGPSE